MKASLLKGLGLGLRAPAGGGIKAGQASGTGRQPRLPAGQPKI